MRVFRRMFTKNGTLPCILFRNRLIKLDIFDWKWKWISEYDWTSLASLQFCWSLKVTKICLFWLLICFICSGFSWFYLRPFLKWNPCSNFLVAFTTLRLNHMNVRILTKDIAWNKDNCIYLYAVVVVIVAVVVTRDWNQTSYVSLKLYAKIKGTAKSLWYFPLKHS